MYYEPIKTPASIQASASLIEIEEACKSFKNDNKKQQIGQEVLFRGGLNKQLTTDCCSLKTTTICNRLTLYCGTGKTLPGVKVNRPNRIILQPV